MTSSSHSPESSAPDRQAATTHPPDVPDLGDSRRVVYWRRAVGCATNLEHRERTVLRHYECFMDWTTFRTTHNPGYDAVATELGMHTKTLQAVVRSLIGKGWMRVARNSYRRPDGGYESVLYEMMIGEHRAFGKAADSCDSHPETGGVAMTHSADQGESLRLPRVSHYDSPGGVTMTHQSSSSSTSSSSSAPAALESPESVGTTDEEEDEDRQFDTLIKRWPNPKARSKTARENARAEWDRLVTRPGFQAETILLHLRRDIESGTVSTSTWPDAWMNATFAPATLKAEEQKRAAEQRRTAIATCGTCDDYGWIEHRTDAFFPTTQRCTHPGIDELAVTAAHIKSQPGYDAYRDAPRPSRPTFHDDDVAPLSMWDRVPLVS